MAIVTTIHGDMDEALLEKREGQSADGARYVEYWLDGQLVHRSVCAGLTGVQADSIAAKLG